MQPEIAKLEPRLKEILYGVMESIRATKAAIYLLDGDAGYSLVTSYGFGEGLPRQLPFTHPLPDRLAMRRAPFFVNTIAEEPRFSEMLFHAKSERMLATPVYSRGRLAGFVDMRDKAAKQPFDADDVAKGMKIVDTILELFAENQLFGQQSLHVEGDKVEAPSIQITRTVETARTLVGRAMSTPSLRERTLTEPEMDAVAVLLPSILLIPGAAVAAFSSFGQLGGGQILVSRRPLTEGALEDFQAKIAGWVSKRGEADALSRSSVRHPFGASGEPLETSHIPVVLSAPVKAAEIKALVLSIGFEQPPDQEGRTLLETFLRQIQQGAEHAASHHAMRQTRQKIAEKLLEPDFQKLPQLLQHSKRVSSMAEQLAQAANLPPAEIENIRLAGLVHDVGMRLLDYNTLYRKKDITETEMRFIQEHPMVGAALIIESGLGYEVAQIVLAHHERVDGKGYPKGLIREQIPLGARILHICEAFDAMTASDSYQKPLPESEAIERIMRGGGAQFDAGFAQKFHQMMTAAHHI
ncbi:MAG TPA: HD domain-containing phosphohydrolase [Thermoanaerobaculia bacterium]|nr:HD domain-containing phosphohydrolase [Thermoanaerobaculia bacterium]